MHKLHYPENFQLQQCLFGLNLINPKIRNVGLAEGEKTSVVLSAFPPEITCLAHLNRLGTAIVIMVMTCLLGYIAALLHCCIAALLHFYIE